MKHCLHCNKALTKGSEVHRVDDLLFCSKSCAITHIEDDIRMNAAYMAQEQYRAQVNIVDWVGPQTFDTTSTEICPVCDIDLSTCDTIHVAEGIMYCSRDCGVHDFEYKYGSVAERHFDNVAEEIRPQDAGIKSAYEEV